MGRRKKLVHDKNGHPSCPDCGGMGFSFKMNKDKQEVMYCVMEGCTWWMKV